MVDLFRGRQKRQKEDATEQTGLLTSQEESDDKSEDVTKDSESKEVPRPSKCYSFFLVVNFQAIAIAALMAISQALTFPWQLSSEIKVIADQVLRVYIFLLSVMFILSEFRVKRFFKLVPSLESWVYRGFLYSFVGLIAVQQSYASLTLEYHEIEGIPQKAMFLTLKVSAYGMFFLGILYMFMGILCLKRLREHLLERYYERVEEAATSHEV